MIEFLDDLLTLRENNGNKKLWYRGLECTDYELIPTIGRKLPYAGKTRTFPREIERELLHRFRRRTYLEFGRLLAAGEALFVARHHGLPTRLLDWTANALFGLYFACAGDPTKPATLWALKRVDDDLEQLDSLELARCEEEKQLFDKFDGFGACFKIVEPLYNSRRLLAQDGAFTIHDQPTTPLEKYVNRSLPNGSLDIEVLFKWTIGAGWKPKLLEQLSGLGITHRMVFPELDGIARSLWETDVLWCGNKPV